MVKKNICATADDSDADVVEAWMEEAPKRVSHKRGPYKTYRGVPCKTDKEKKEAQAIKYKRWKQKQQTEAAKNRVADNKRVFAKANAIRKTKAFKKESEQLAKLREENNALRERIAILEKKTGVSKKTDDYRQKMYNEMLDLILGLKKTTHKHMTNYPIELPSYDTFFNQSIQRLRAFVRSFMTKSDNLVNSRYPDK